DPAVGHPLAVHLDERHVTARVEAIGDVREPVLELRHGGDLVHPVLGVDRVGDRRHERGGGGASGVHPQSKARNLGDHDYPTRFSLPVRLAYRSARPNAQRPRGMKTIPISSSGHTSPRSDVIPSPSISPARTPCSTYVAGLKFERTCIQPGRMSTL